MSEINNSNLISETMSKVPKPFKHQVGGHSVIFRYKKMICKMYTKAEYDFYLDFNTSQLQEFIPKFYGKLSLNSKDIDEITSNRGELHVSPWSKQCLDKFVNHEKNDIKETNLPQFILLEDCTKGFRKPCILDLKIGTRVW
eukprot:gene1053-10572_t